MTSIRPEISKKNRYWIDKHRFYELRHFCLQYPTWKKLCNSFDSFSKMPSEPIPLSSERVHGDPVLSCVEFREYYLKRMNMVERAAKEADAELANYILKGVTEGISYDGLKAKLEIPCCKDTYYELYRRFFWLLSKERC